jgi:hypothetical protein
VNKELDNFDNLTRPKLDPSIRAGKSPDDPQLLSTIVHAINHSMANLLTFSSSLAIGTQKVKGCKVM